MRIQRTDENGVSRFTVTDGSDDHSFEAFHAPTGSDADSQSASETEVVVEYQESQHARGRVSSDEVPHDALSALVESEAFTDRFGESAVIDLKA